MAHVPFELRAVLGNLITNAIEALEADGRILIRAKDNGGDIEISVSDIGKGIASETLLHIFEKNFSSGKPNGSGIGLSHAKEHIENWGGSVLAESVLGVGTTITIRLPVKDRAAWYVPRLGRSPVKRQFSVPHLLSLLVYLNC